MASKSGKKNYFTAESPAVKVNDKSSEKKSGISVADRSLS